MNNIEIQGAQRTRPHRTEPHRSEGSESISAGRQANMSQNDERSVNEPAISGSTAGDEGWLDTVTDEPEVYPSEYLSSQQQRPYIYWSIAAILLMAALVLLST